MQDLTPPPVQKEIRYRDKQGNEKKYRDAEIIRICDDLLDICNGIALAYKVLFLTRQEGGYCIPQQLLLEELQEETGTPWWKIDGCVYSEISGQKQLILYAYAQTRDYSKVQYSAIQSGVLAELFSPGYDRYFLSIRSDHALPGWAAFDGNKLAQLRQRNDRTLSDYRGILENDLVFFVPTFKFPRILTKLETLLHSFRLKWPLVMADVRKQQGKATITARNATIHRNAWGCVLNAAVVIEAPDGEVDQNIIRNSCGSIVRAALRAARRNSKASNFVRYLPLGYARVFVFRADYRRRRLEGFGLEGDLVGTIQVQRIKRIKSPDILGATIEEMGRYRIAWNHSWLESIRGN